MEDRMGNQNSKMLAWVILLFVAAIFSGQPASGQSANLVEQAKKEGEVILYTTMTVGDFAVFNQAVKEKYPFLNVRHVYLSTSRQTARVMQEHRAGKLQADVLGNSIEPMIYLKTQGVIGKYESPEAKHLVKGAFDPEGYWLGTTTDLLITAFNSREYSKGTAPKSYDDYLSPKFKGQMATNSGSPYPLSGMISLRGEEQGIAYMRKLGQQDVRPVEGYTHITNLLAAGEFPLAIFMQVSKIDAMKRKGGPVDWLPGGPTLATLSTIALAQNPPHPAAARLLMDFYLSPEGQQALSKAGKIPLRKGVKSPSEEIDSLLKGDSLHVVQAKGEASKIQRLYAELLGVR
jgi:iron(III) transport system substrate-binding protein